MSDDLKVDDGNKDDKEARRKRKELRRQKREDYHNRLNAVDKTVPEQRNPIIMEILDHLKKDLNVFQARWQRGTVLSNEVFMNTPLFWYKKHKWTHKDVKEFFRIVGAYRDGLDSELNVIWGIDEHSKKRRKEQRRKLKEKHLRKESFASLMTLRHSSLQLVQSRSMQFVRREDPKAEKASVQIWNLLVKDRGGSEVACPELNHAQFNICCDSIDITIDPDMSVDLFYELIRTYEIIERHREDKRKNPEKYKSRKKSKYKESRSAGTAMPLNGPSMIGGIGSLSFSINGRMSSINDEQETEVSPSPKERNQNQNEEENKESASTTEKETDSASKPKEEEQKEDAKPRKLSKEQEAELPQKDKIKYIKKRTINRQYIKRMLRHINKNITLQHQRSNPKKLKKSKLLLVVFGKIFEAIQNERPFDVQNDYISQALTADQLNSPQQLLEILETRDAEWKQRVQCLEYVETNISINDNLAPLFEEENFLSLIVGWTTQLYDERSRITQTAAELFPSLLTQLLTKMETPATIFEAEHGCLSTMLEALFTLLKNKRAKTLSEIAHDVLIETINILATVAEDLDVTAVHRIAEFLHQHTLFEVEKHEKIRAGCIAYSLFIVYGTESQEIHNNALKENAQLTMDMLPLPGLGHKDKSISMVSLDSASDLIPPEQLETGNLSDAEDNSISAPNGQSPEDVDGGNDEPTSTSREATMTIITRSQSADSNQSANGDESEHKLQSSTSKLFTLDKAAKEKNVKIAKKPQRAQLFEDEVFMGIFAKIIGNGIEDRGKESREKAMKVLKKIESSHREILEKYIDGVHLNKYEKWKRFNAPKGKKKGKSKRKRISPIKRSKTAPAKKMAADKAAIGTSLSVPDVIENEDEDDNENGNENGKIEMNSVENAETETSPLQDGSEAAANE